MKIPKWILKRKIKKFSNIFANFIRQQDIQSALEIYTLNLLPYRGEVSRPLRTIYHFYNWIIFDQEKDYNALQVLAVNETTASSVVRASTYIRHMKLQREITAAFQQENPAQTLWDSANALLHKKPLENVGLGILAALIYYKNSKPQLKNLPTITDILRNIKQADSLEGPMLTARNWLYMWTMTEMNNYRILLEDMDQMPLTPNENRSRYKVMIAGKWCQQLLIAGQVKEAAATHNSIRQHQEYRDFVRVSLAFGLQLLTKKETSDAVAWFTHYSQSLNFKDMESLHYTFLFFEAVAHLKDNRSIQGRRILDTLVNKLEGTDENTGVFLGNLISRTDLEFLSGYLQSVSLLSETRGWEYDSQAGQTSGFSVQWRQVKENLRPYLSKMAASSSPLAWRLHFLEGLLAYIETGSAANMELLHQFTAAIETGAKGNKTLMGRLKNIEGTLLTRIKATDEAIQLVVQRQYKKLAEFYTRVLYPLGDTIPPLVRAAVLMSLWEKDPAFDPLPGLQKIPTASDTVPHVNKCMAQIQAFRVMQSLIRACTASPPLNEALPSLSPLDIEPQLAGTGALGAALVYLGKEDWAMALRCMDALPPSIDPWYQKYSGYITFYAAWKIGTTDTCLEISQDSRKNKLLVNQKYLKGALNAHLFISALEKEREEIPKKVIAAYYNKKQWPQLLTSIVIWLIEHEYTSAALFFLELVKKESKDGDVTGIYSFLAGLVTAKLGRYNNCISHFEHTISYDPSGHLAFVEPKRYGKLQGWAKLFKLQAQLALTAQSTDDVNLRWPALRRILETQAKELETNPQVQPYGFLIMGLVSHLSADMLIDESIIVNLVMAQKVLPLERKNRFIEEIIGKLNWRKKILEDFWGNLSRGNFRESQAIYQRELKPDFGDRLPPSIQLAMVMVDWDMNSAKTPELIKRLAVLEHEAPELNKEFIAKVKNYILDGDKCRHLTQLIADKEFDIIIDFIQKTRWEGFEEGAMPLPVAITLQHAYYKTKKEQEALEFGTQISESKGLPDWIKNYGMLILGYVLFSRGEFKKAAGLFEKISCSTVLGHDVDKYWAASHFSNGLRLIEGQQTKQEAFDSFSLALKKRGSEPGNIDLAPLFFHLALNSIVHRNGQRALSAFQFLKTSTQDLEPSPGLLKIMIQSKIGELLCRSLMDDKEEPLDKEDFLALLNEIKQEEKVLGEKNKMIFERVCRILVMCYVMKKKLYRRNELEKFLKPHLRNLELLGESLFVKEPQIYALRALVELLIKHNSDKALEWYEMFKKLGGQSFKIDQLFARSPGKDMSGEIARAIDIFDCYLNTGDIPFKSRKQLVRTDDISELYRLHCSYSPSDVISSSEIQTGVEVMCKRLNHLVKWANSGTTLKGPHIDELKSRLIKDIEEIQKMEKGLLENEQSLLKIIARKMRNESSIHMNAN